jgi:hypothetical protein
MTTVCAVLWRYGDGSSSGAVKVFARQEDAEELAAFLREFSDREFQVVELPFDDGEALDTPSVP